MSKECGIVRDLLPLVIDEVATEESREYVETHISTCKECDMIYREMKKEIPGKTENEKEKDQEAFSKAAGKMKRKRRARTLKHVLLGVLIACILFGAGLFGYHRLSQAREHVYYGLYSVYLSEMKNGDVVITMDYNGSYNELGTFVTTETEKDARTGKEKTVMYVWLEKFILPREMENPMQNGPIMTLTAEQMKQYDEVRSGVPSEYLTIWTAGEAIGKASEQMEEYYFWDCIDRQMTERLFGSQGGKTGYADYEMHTRWNMVRAQMTAIKATVPEWQPWTQDAATERLNRETADWVLSVMKEYGIEVPDP